jgi:hypothetical protein
MMDNRTNAMKYGYDLSTTIRFEIFKGFLVHVLPREE